MIKILTAILLFSLTVFSQAGKDTTITVDLNFDRAEETIKCSFDESAQGFTLKINKAEVSKAFNDAYDFDVEIIDISRNDNLREVLVKGYGNSDQCDMHFFQYIDGKIVEAGRLPSNFGIEVKGNGEITENAWMGFWTMKVKYDFDTRNKMLVKIEEEFYDVGQVCEVKNSFRLLTRREDDAPAAAELKPKTKLYIIKADVSPKCKSTDGYDDDFFCDWYFIKTDDGREGWIRLRNFYENVDGLVWAG